MTTKIPLTAPIRKPSADAAAEANEDARLYAASGDYRSAIAHAERAISHWRAALRERESMTRSATEGAR